MPTRPVDLMPQFWRAYDAGRHVDGPGRVVSLAANFFLPQASWYTAAGFNGAGTHGRLLDDRVAEWLTRLDRLAAPARAVSAALPAAWDRHCARFASAGLVLPPGAGVCFLPSLLSFTGYSHVWHARPMLFVAPDGVAAFSGDIDVAVLLDHEAFHVWHDATAPDVAGSALWARLWREGLATYASARLNPSATMRQVLMSGDLAFIPPSVIAAAARLGLASLDDTRLIAPLFDIGSARGFPERMGYLLGLRIVQGTIGPRTLVEAAHLPAAQVQAAVAAGLAMLADHGCNSVGCT